MKGRFTFRFAAVCFGFSALFELFSLQDEALLFGHSVGGAGAVTYHLIYAALFAYLMAGLWEGARSGYYMLLATSAIYTVDRLQSVFVGDALAVLLRQQIAEHPQILQVISADDLVRTVTLTTFAMLAGWWGFVIYAYFRRDYFGINNKSARVS